MRHCEMRDVTADEARRRLRDLATNRLGLARSAMPDVQIDRALERLTTGLKDPVAEIIDGLGALSLNDPAWQRVVAALVIGETRFFRQTTWFSQLEEYVLKPLIADELKSGRKRLRLWSAACASGEEAYTLAMLVDRLLPSYDGWDISIAGTDINARFLEDARRGVYPARSLRELDDGACRRYFQPVDGDRFKVVASLRNRVSWQVLNLADKAPAGDKRFTNVDLIICRNVLMYLTPEHQRSAAGRLIERLGPRGWLAVAPAEAVAEWYRPLMPVNVPSAIFFRAEPADQNPQSRKPPQRAPHALRTRAKRAGVVAAPNSATAKIVAKPPPAEDEIKRIRELADRGRLAEARLHCETLLSSDSLSYDAQLLLALICDELRDGPAALQAAQRAIYLNPTSAPAHFLCGMALARLGRSQQAKQKMNDVMQLLDAGGAIVSSAWDVSEERLRSAAADNLAGSNASGLTIGAR
jgi:chemotaxis protein methyltransferase CheR